MHQSSAHRIAWSVSVQLAAHWCPQFETHCSGRPSLSPRTCIDTGPHPPPSYTPMPLTHTQLEVGPSPSPLPRSRMWDSPKESDFCLILPSNSPTSNSMGLHTWW